MTAHTLYECPDSCEGCQICNGGLASCTVCMGGEASLPTECPGQYMNDWAQAAVSAGAIDFKDGAWRYRVPGGYAALPYLWVQTVNRAFWQFLRDAPVQSGVCVCGDTVGTCTDHGSVDMWDHSLEAWLEDERVLAERVAAALIRLIALEDNAANLARWEQLQREVGG